MQLFRIVLVALAMLAVAGGYLQEVRHLAVIKRLGGEKAREYYEATRQRTERLLLVVTVGLALIAAGAAVYVFVIGR